MFRTAPKEHVHLKDIATYSIGLTYKPENVKSTGIPVLRSGNIQEESLDFGDLVRVNSSIPDTLLLRDGDILMCSRNGSAHLVGKVARIRQLPEPMTYGAFMTVIRSEYMDYLFFFFQSDDFRQQISYGKSSTMNQITQKMLDQITLDLPSRAEIGRLSPLLEQADKSKFAGFKSQFIEETKRWSTRSTIGGLVDVNITKAGKKFKAESTIQYIDISSVDNATNTVLGATEYVFKDAPSRAQQCIKAGDILVSTVRPNLKNIAVNHLSDNNLVASSGFCVLRPRDGYTGLLLAYILSDEFTEKMTLVAKGTNYPAVHDSDILDYEITVPEKNEVKRIDSLYRQSDKSKYLN